MLFSCRPYVYACIIFIVKYLSLCCKESQLKMVWVSQAKPKSISIKIVFSDWLNSTMISFTCGMVWENQTKPNQTKPSQAKPSQGRPGLAWPGLAVTGFD